MRVVCNSLQEFICDLARQVKEQGPECVIQKMVRVSISKQCLDAENQNDGVRFGVTFQASGVIALKDGGEYLLQMGVDCGVDYEDATKERNGSKEANKLRVGLASFCEKEGLLVGPGTIEL